MTGWGDYAITAVQYNYDNTRIKQVKRKEVKPEILTNTRKIDRSTVVTSIESGNDYTTAFKNESSGKWQLGDEVHVLEVGGEMFIRTDQNDTEEDNLDNLPTF
ncbi:MULTISPECIES: DUF3892 domain-containing protein [unclassified Haloferax]|uniref:DUF3892 domain-containing protein n=1 Tax=unclassified Haloferax TaxID=2625095 RepID=UPI000E230443|nr:MULTISPECIES: DUF3892 domain-containing protein [unclassified Haloferax]RDZ35526.1 hypothetical protein C5B88_14190 [Haloferax sp. Atlit-24N]RLM35938.1 DUF3892 domain-containing protein [Haloferax sp. Atlit-109R]RLM43788.1 DUF3892 domain-containing protein [Haloferax sp. Atlit-105R]